MDSMRNPRLTWPGRDAKPPAKREQQEQRVRMMDADAKKTALRMIPYGIYVMTAEAGGEIAAATVNWVTQTAFAPPLLVVGLKVGTNAYGTVKKAGCFALNILGRGQKATAFTFFKPVKKEGERIGGEPFRSGSTGAPIFDNAIASIECRIVEIVERGDHHIVIGEVVDANVAKAPDGRADDAILHMRELGDNVFYGG